MSIIEVFVAKYSSIKISMSSKLSDKTCRLSVMPFSYIGSVSLTQIVFNTLFRQNARRLTFALAKAFQDFSKTVKGNPQKRKPKQFAIDIRTPEQIEEDMQNEVDSEV